MRTEKDSLGSIEIPDEAYHGVQAQRARQNFPISGLRLHSTFIRAYALLKEACLRANVAMGEAFDPKHVTAIEQACKELQRGLLHDHIIVDVYQAGAGTSTNMNVNEVIANRALELMDRRRGDYETISPNDDVNRSQSTNDSYPSAMRIAIVLMLREKLYPAITDLKASLVKQADLHLQTIRSARTHLQDAVPVTFGQNLEAYVEILRRHEDRLLDAELDVAYLGIGGSAAGSALNTPADYKEKVVEFLNEATELEFKNATDLFEAMQSMAPFVHVAGQLKNLALDLFKFSADLRLLASGPMTGLFEIELPAVQPGSSIMPGKVNPSILEMLSQVCIQVVGNEAAVAMASQAGQLELNVMMPVIQHNITFSIEILSNAMRVTADRVIDGLVVNEERMRAYAEASSSIVTALAPRIGYLEAAAIAKESLTTRRTIRELILERRLLGEVELDALLKLEAMARPHGDPH